MWWERQREVDREFVKRQREIMERQREIVERQGEK